VADGPYSPRSSQTSEALPRTTSAPAVSTAGGVHCPSNHPCYHHRSVPRLGRLRPRSFRALPPVCDLPAALPASLLSTQWTWRRLLCCTVWRLSRIPSPSSAQSLSLVERCDTLCLGLIMARGRALLKIQCSTHARTHARTHAQQCNGLREVLPTSGGIYSRSYWAHFFSGLADFWLSEVVYRFSLSQLQRVAPHTFPPPHPLGMRSRLGLPVYMAQCDTACGVTDQSGGRHLQPVWCRWMRCWRADKRGRPPRFEGTSPSPPSDSSRGMRPLPSSLMATHARYHRRRR
jgi:hypothetical protein